MNMGMVGLLVIELICHVVMSWSESMLSVISRQKLPIVIPTILHWLLTSLLSYFHQSQMLNRYCILRMGGLSCIPVWYFPLHFRFKPWKYQCLHTMWVIEVQHQHPSCALPLTLGVLSLKNCSHWDLRKLFRKYFCTWTPKGVDVIL